MTAFKDWLNGLTSKTTPVDADEVYVRDSSGTPSSKKLTWANLKATLANTFLSLTGGTITDTTSAGSGSLAGSTLTVNQTWNTTGTPTAVKLDVTDTASNAASLLMDLQVGGASKVSVGKDGSIRALSNSFFFGTATIPALWMDTNTVSPSTSNYAIYVDGALTCLNGSGSVALRASNTTRLLVQSSEVTVSTTGGLGLGSSNYLAWSSDLSLFRDAADTLAQRNGTNAQTFRLYNTYTDASNYERGFMRWNANVLEMGAEAAGTGTARTMYLRSSMGAYVTSSTSSQLSNLTSGRVYFSTGVSDTQIGVISAHENRANWKSDFVWSWGATSYNDTQDAGLIRAAAGVVGITGGATAGGAAQFVEMTAPAAPATNGVRIYAEDNGSGKTRLMALFATGAAVQIAIEP